MRIFFSTILAIIFFQQILFAQNNIVLPDTSAKQLYFKKVKELKLRGNPNYYYKYNLNLSKLAELKAAGVDVFEMDKKVGELNYKEYGLVSNCIVQGTVLSKEYDSRKDVYFHSKYKILVKEVIKGKIVNDTIVLKLISGIVGDTYLSAGNEPEFYLGENILLFLDKMPMSELEEAKRKKFLNGQINADPSSFVLRYKYCDKGGYIYNNDRKLGKKEDIIGSISNIIKINNQ